MGNEDQINSNNKALGGDTLFELDIAPQNYQTFISGGTKKVISEELGYISLDKDQSIAIINGDGQKLLLTWKQANYNQIDLPVGTEVLTNEDGAFFELKLPEGTNISFKGQYGFADKPVEVNTDEMSRMVKENKSLGQVWEENGKMKEYGFKLSDLNPIGEGVAAGGTALGISLVTGIIGRAFIGGSANTFGSILYKGRSNFKDNDPVTATVKTGIDIAMEGAENALFNKYVKPTTAPLKESFFTNTSVGRGITNVTEYAGQKLDVVGEKMNKVFGKDFYSQIKDPVRAFTGKKPASATKAATSVVTETADNAGAAVANSDDIITVMQEANGVIDETAALAKAAREAGNSASGLADVVKPVVPSTPVPSGASSDFAGNILEDISRSFKQEPTNLAGQFVDEGDLLVEVAEETAGKGAPLIDTPQGAKVAESVFKASEEAKALQPASVITKTTDLADNVIITATEAAPSAGSSASAGANVVDEFATAADDIAEGMVNGVSKGPGLGSRIMNTVAAPLRTVMSTPLAQATAISLEKAAPVLSFAGAAKDWYVASNHSIENYQNAKTEHEKDKALAEGITQTVVDGGVMTLAAYGAGAVATTAIGGLLTVGAVNVWNPVGWGCLLVAGGIGIYNAFSDSTIGEQIGGWVGSLFGDDEQVKAKPTVIAKPAAEHVKVPEKQVVLSKEQSAKLRAEAKFVARDDVKEMQTMLNEKLGIHLAVDGKWGVATTKALIQAGLLDDVGKAVGLDEKRIATMAKFAESDNQMYFKILNQRSAFGQIAEKGTEKALELLAYYEKGSGVDHNKIALDKDTRNTLLEIRDTTFSAESTMVKAPPLLAGLTLEGNSKHNGR